MNLYIYNNFKNRKESRTLLSECIRLYMKEKYNADKEKYDFVIMETGTGKPYVRFSEESTCSFTCKNRVPQLYFNVSHSGELWICGISDSEVGVDAEVICPEETEDVMLTGQFQADRPLKHKKIVEKYFNTGEKNYIKEYGEQGFYRIWTFKEAVTKLYGKSIFRGISENAVENGKIVENKDNIFFSTFNLTGTADINKTGENVNTPEQKQIYAVVTLAEKDRRTPVSLKELLPDKIKKDTGGEM